MREFLLTRNQRDRLRRQLRHTEDAAVYRRTLAILELDQGQPVSDIARSLGVTRQSISNWFASYVESFDPAALADDARSGRPPTWTPQLDASLQALLQGLPTDWDYPAVNWTVPLLQQELASEAGMLLSEDTIRRRLHDWGYVWKRTRYVLPPDPDKEKKTPDTPASEKPAFAERRAVRG
jgi:transposase